MSFVSGQDNYPLINAYDIEHDTIVLPQTELLLSVLVAAATVAVAVVIMGASLRLYLKKRSH